MSGIFHYPNFKKITIEDKKTFDEFNKFAPYSDFNLLSLLSWNTEESNTFSILNNNLVIRIKNYLDDGFTYSILGESKIDDSLKLLLGNGFTLGMVPEVTVSNIQNREAFIIEEDRDNFDYIVSTKLLSELEGSDFKQIRKYINSFKKNYPNYQIKEMNLENPSETNEILKITKDWVSIKEFDANKLEEELAITSKFLDLAKYFKSVLIGLYIEDKLIAYTFNEIVSEEYVMGHFGKSINTYEYSSKFIEHETSKFFFDKGFKYINHEQDTGIEGLRIAKLSYKPVFFLKKFKIRLS